QKEWIVLANRPEIPYEYRWILANAEQYLVTPVANGGFDIALKSQPETSAFQLLPASFIDGNGDTNYDQVTLEYGEGVFTLRLLDQERIVFPIAIDPSIQLNTGVTSLALGMDMTSQLTGLNPGETVAYQWMYDPDGGGILPVEHFMSLNVPFNTGSTQRDFSGNSGTNGTVTNAIVQTSGCQVGACISFDGNGDYVTFPDTTVWDFNDELTFSVWHLAPQADIANQVVLAQG